LYSTSVEDPSTARARLRVVGDDEQQAPVDPSDFNSIYRRYAAYVATIGLRILGKPDEVDDLIQDVFLVAHDDIGRLREPERIRGWLATIAVRKASRRLKLNRLRRFLPLSDPDTSFEVLADPAANPEQRAEVGRVYQILERWNPDDRVVWILRHVQGCTLDEVCEFTGLSKSTVQRRLRKGDEHFQKTTGQRKSQ